MCFVSSTVRSTFVVPSSILAPAGVTESPPLLLLAFELLAFFLLFSSTLLLGLPSFFCWEGEDCCCCCCGLLLACCWSLSAVAAAAWAWGIFCRTMRVADPSESFFMKFQASILLIRVQSLLFTDIISSPTFRTFVLSAAPPEKTERKKKVAWVDSTIKVAPKAHLLLPVKIFLMVRGLSPRGESLPPSRLNPSPVPSFFKITVMGAPRGTSTNFKSAKEETKKIINQIQVWAFNFYLMYLTRVICCQAGSPGSLAACSSSCWRSCRRRRRSSRRQPRWTTGRSNRSRPESRTDSGTKQEPLPRGETAKTKREREKYKVSEF